MSTAELPLDYADQDRRKANAKTFRPHLNREQCPCCGGPTVEYRHGLSRQLGEILIRLYRRGGRAPVRDLFLSYSGASNTQKLRYWNLIEHTTSEDKKAAIWSLTKLGEQFVRATTRLPKHAWSYRGRVVELEGEMILITDLVPEYNSRISYAEESRPHGPST